MVDELTEINARIPAPDEAARLAARRHWNDVAKPIGSLGVLETIVEQIAALTGDERVSIERRVAVVMCADNGVVNQGVSQCGQNVTTAVASNIVQGTSSICSMCKPIGVDTLAVDMGMTIPVAAQGVLDRHIARGTADISCGPAMTREQALEAIRIGIELVGELKNEGYELIATGEMGIGNTTTSTAMAAVFLGLPVREVTGRGAGLSDAGFERKVDAIERALHVNVPDPAAALDVLFKLGGFDIAGLTGLFIGGALHRVPVIVDGFISAIAAYAALRLAPACSCAMIASHVSSEPAAKMLLDKMGLIPVISAGMHLGEGTGAACLIPLLDMALSLYDGITFDETGIEAYDPDLS